MCALTVVQNNKWKRNAVYVFKMPFKFSFIETNDTSDGLKNKKASVSK